MKHCLCVTASLTIHAAVHGGFGTVAAPRPTIAVLLTVCDPDPRHLAQAIDSVLRQTAVQAAAIAT